MAQYRMLVTHELSTAATAIDYVVNTFYLDTDEPPGTGDPQQLCVDAAALFAGYRSIPEGYDVIRVRAYDMSDAIPRLPRGEATGAPIDSGVGGPREVALCLSYYAEVNQPRRRGRMYIGPWHQAAMLERPNATNRGYLATLAEGISGLGGINVQWVQFSPTTGEFHNVTDYWIDDEWDTMRSRGLEGTTRTAGTVSG